MWIPEKMLARVGRSSRALKKVAVPQPTVTATSAFSTSSKSWVPSSDEKLQKITMQSLVHELAEQQKELAQQVSLQYHLINFNIPSL